MATRKVKPKIEITGIVPSLRPSHDDAKYHGEEPDFLTVTHDNRKISVIRACNWYSKFFDRKDGKEFICAYLEKRDQTVLAQFMKVSDAHVEMSIAWLARMAERGLKLTEDEEAKLSSHVEYLLGTMVKEKPVKTEETAKPKIQETMLDKAREAGGELEGLFDEFLNDPRLSHGLKPIDELAKKNILPQHIPMLVNSWNKKLAEFNEVADGKDRQLTEAYSNLSKVQVRHTIKYIEQVIADLNSYVTVKRTAKVRIKKPVSPEKQAANVKFLKEFELGKQKFVSLHPSKLIVSCEAWVYDTDKRKLHHYIADEYSKTFTVKGTTLLGFDGTTSEMKTLRKPEESLKSVMGGKPAARKFFKELSTTPSAPSGRFNENMIILKAF